MKILCLNLGNIGMERSALPYVDRECQPTHNEAKEESKMKSYETHTSISRGLHETISATKMTRAKIEAQMNKAEERSLKRKAIERK
ncbi:MAG: hypothetical protein ACJAXQ_000434 [Parvibaculaceae bacterium]|jgi:hypothetical protein|tara:strand:- start:273 stop:530 length:258 start_codon:yes stop_codon:yes gene_type:complete